MIRLVMEGDSLFLRDSTGELGFTPFDTVFLANLVQGTGKNLIDQLRVLYGSRDCNRIFRESRERLVRFVPKAVEFSIPSAPSLPPLSRTPLPTLATLFLTMRCKAGCRFCDFAAFRSGSTDELDAGSWKTIITNLASAGCREIALTGGEPTLHPAFREIAGSVRSAGCRLVVQTRNPGAAKVLEDLAPYRVMVGLDTVSPHTAELLYGDAHLPNGLLDLLARMNAAHIRTVVSVVASETNEVGLPALFEKLAATGVRNVITSLDRTTATHMPEEKRLHLLFLARKSGLALTTKAGLPPSPANCASCNVGWSRCIIAPSGNMLPCDQPTATRSHEAGSFNIGNWKTLPLMVQNYLAATHPL